MAYKYGILIKKKNIYFFPPLVYADNSTGRPWEGEMLGFVTWEVFLLLAVILAGSSFAPGT